MGRPGFARTAVYRLRKELKSAGIGDLIEAVRGVGFQIADPGDRAAVAFDPENALMFATTAIFVVSPERRVIWANPAAERLSGYPLAELRELPSTLPLLGGGGPRVYEPMRREVVSGRVLQGMARLRIKDGSELEVPASWKPVFDPSGELLYTITEFWPALSHADVSQAG